MLTVNTTSPPPPQPQTDIRILMHWNAMSSVWVTDSCNYRRLNPSIFLAFVFSLLSAKVTLVSHKNRRQSCTCKSAKSVQNIQHVGQNPELQSCVIYPCSKENHPDIRFLQIKGDGFCLISCWTDAIKTNTWRPTSSRRKLGRASEKTSQMFTPKLINLSSSQHRVICQSLLA
jgi:hypothetical protein